MECNEIEDPTDLEVWEYINEELAIQFEDEHYNLDVKTENDILVIADLGLWNGRKQGYKIIPGNVRNIFNDMEDYTEWYSDGHNIKATAIHHDGHNYYEYRVIRPERNIKNLLDKIYSGKELSRKTLNYYTKSLLPYVKKVYGW